MKAQNLQAGKYYVALAPWGRSKSADQRDPFKVERGTFVYKVELVSMARYKYTVWKSANPQDSNFIPAESSDRSIGYLMRAHGVNNDGSDLYWLSRTQDIVGEWDLISKRWAEEDAIREAKDAKEAQARAERQRKYDEADALKVRVKDTLTQTIATITNKQPQYVETYTRSRTVNNQELVTATMEIDIKTLQRLVEAVLEAKDMVA